MSSILLPSTKSVHQRVLDLLGLAGIQMDRVTSKRDTDILLSGIRWPTTAAFVHQSRIPQLVASGEYTLGVVGLDAVKESGVDVEICADLLFNRSTWNKAKIVVVTGEGCPENVLDGAEVLTEYPRLTREYFKKMKRKVVIVPSRGSVESEVPKPYPLGVCLSETGQSLRANGLRVIGEIMETSTMLITNKNAYEDEETRENIRTFKAILLGVIAAREKVMLIANVPTANLSGVLSILPALRSPTVTPLANSKYVSVSVVVSRSELNGVQEQLLKHGAEDIVVMPIASLIQSL